MPTKDIKSDYFAAGNGQQITATCSRTGSTLTVAGAGFVVGDIGKHIAMRAVFSGVSTPAPVIPCSTTITGRTSSTVVTVSTSGTIASGTYVVEWGTDDTGAFNTFNAAMQGLTGVVLTVPAGRYCLATSPSGGGWTLGITGLQVTGTGSPTISNMLDNNQGSNYGGTGAGINTLAALGTGSSLVETVSPGSFNLTATTPGIFTANTWAILTGFNVQGTGDPPSYRWFEYVYITDISGSVLTLLDPVKYQYLSTWPQWTSSGPNRGGPATLYLLDSDWDSEQTYTGINIEEWWGGPNIKGRSVTLNTVTMPAFPITPTEERDVTLTSCTNTAFTVEVDKLIENMTVTGGTWKGMACQSPSPQRLTMTGVTVTGNLSCPVNTVLDGCTIGTSLSDSFGTGPTQSGYSDALVATDTVFNASIKTTNNSDLVESNVFGGYTLSGGTFTGSFAAHETTLWAVPGAVCFLGGTQSYSYPFQVLGVYPSGSDIKIVTTLNGLPTIPNSGTYSIGRHPCPSISFRNCSGLDDAGAGWGGAILGKPAGTYWSKTYTSFASAQAIDVFGEVTRVVFNVTDAFTAGTLDWGTSAGVMRMSDGTVQSWAPVIDLTQLGTRTITASGVTGAVGSDATLAFVAGGMWVWGGQMTPTPHGSPASGSITITIETDHGFLTSAVMHSRRTFGVEAGVADPNDDFYEPGNQNPAISSSDYYHQHGLYAFCCYDLRKMGTEGNAIADSRGYRYAWVWGPDHPLLGQAWRESGHLMVGFSNDPGVLPDPSTVIAAVPSANQGNITCTEPAAYSGTAAYGQFPCLVYNPDDPDGLPFYLYGETSVAGPPSFPGHLCGLARSADLVTWTFWGISIPTDLTTGVGWSSFNVVIRRASGDWIATGLAGGFAGFLNNIFAVCNALYKSTNGRSFTKIEEPFHYRIINGMAPNEVTAAHFTFNSTTKVLTCTDVDLWTSANVGDAINVYGVWSRWWAIIGTVTDARHITLTGGAITYMTTDVSTPTLLQVEWGHLIEGRPYNDLQCFLNLTCSPVTVGAQTYLPTKETNLSIADIKFMSEHKISLLPIDEDFNPIGAATDIVVMSPTNEYAAPCTPQQQNYVQGLRSYQEDGILHLYALRCYSSQINIGDFTGGNPGSPWGTGAGGSLNHEYIDYYTYIVDVAPACNAAPVGVTASCAAGVVTISWKDALPHTNYRVYRGTTAGTQATLVGDVSGVSTTNSPGTGRFWYKIVTMNGVEQQFRVVDVYVSSLSVFCNKHINRVLADGGNISTINTTYLALVDAWLESNSQKVNLLMWSDTRFGYRESGGHITKVYDIGTTHLPRSYDLSTHTTATTYSATALDTLPGWVNPNTNSYLYWGKNTYDANVGARFNQIRMKSQITVAALYKRTDTSVDATLLGTSSSTSGGFANPSPFSGAVASYDGIGTGLYLRHSSGTPGTITFALGDMNGTTGSAAGLVVNTATVTGAGTAVQVAVGTFNGTNMFAYSNATAGSANTNQKANADLHYDTVLAGARNNAGAGEGPWPFLGSGYKNAQAQQSTYARTFSDTEAKFNAGSMVVLGKGLTSGEVTSLVALLTTGSTSSTVTLMPMGCM